MLIVLSIILIFIVGPWVLLIWSWGWLPWTKRSVWKSSKTKARWQEQTKQHSIQAVVQGAPTDKLLREQIQTACLEAQARTPFPPRTI